MREVACIQQTGDIRLSVCQTCSHRKEEKKLLHCSVTVPEYFAPPIVMVTLVGGLLTVTGYAGAVLTVEPLVAVTLRFVLPAATPVKTPVVLTIVPTPVAELV